MRVPASALPVRHELGISAGSAIWWVHFAQISIPARAARAFGCCCRLVQAARRRRTARRRAWFAALEGGGISSIHQRRHGTRQSAIRLFDNVLGTKLVASHCTTRGSRACLAVSPVGRTSCRAYQRGVASLAASKREWLAVLKWMSDRDGMDVLARVPCKPQRLRSQTWCGERSWLSSRTASLSDEAAVRASV